jgi:hypothetical protein
VGDGAVTPIPRVGPLYALKTVTGDVFTYGGSVLVHPSRAELEYLFPGRETVDVSQSVLPKLMIQDHPGMGAVRFPLRREDFR